MLAVMFQRIKTRSIQPQEPRGLRYLALYMDLRCSLHHTANASRKMHNVRAYVLRPLMLPLHQLRTRGAAAAPPANTLPLSASMRRGARPQLLPAAGDGIHDMLTDGLKWLNWDVSRAYGSSKRMQGLNQGTPGLWSSSTSNTSSSTSTVGSSTMGSSDDETYPDGSSGSTSSSSEGITSVSVKDPAKLERIRKAFAGAHACVHAHARVCARAQDAPVQGS